MTLGDLILKKDIKKFLKEHGFRTNPRAIWNCIIEGKEYILVGYNTEIILIMGSETDGFFYDHIKSKCCNDHIRFKTSGNGYSIQVWCEKCGHYFFTGRVDALIALWLGNLDAVEKNKGYTPSWIPPDTKIE